METVAIASEFMDAFERKALLPTITSRVPDFSIDQAYDVAAELVRRRQAGGETVIGRKFGLTNRAMWPNLGIDAPFWSTLYETTVTFLDSPSGTVDLGGYAQTRLEPEIVVHIGETPPAGADETDLLNYIDWIAFGYEIVQCHYPDWVYKVPDAIADFGLHGALIVGPPHPVGDLTDLVESMRTFTVELSRNGEVQAKGGGTNVLGSPLHALTQVVKLPTFGPLQAGEVITTGTLTAVHAIAPGETWSVTATGINLGHLRLQTR